MPEIPFQAPSIESIAALLPAFDFEHLIAQGGMGAVYKARQRSLDRDVAIKILPHELSDDPDFRASFEAEAKAMAKVVHPNLTTVYDSGDVEGLLYIVMEYIGGKSLFDSAQEEAVDPKRAVEIVMGICRGLAEAHENGIVHRDIKPANILLARNREPKIGDFGLARTAGYISEGLSMGTPGYTAPEVIDHPERADKRSDVFSVGVILRELLTGIPPDQAGISHSEIADPRLREICEKATRPDPSERYQKAKLMVVDLRAWLRAEAASSATPPIVDRSSNNSFARNGAIIIALLAAIFVTWKLLERKQAASAAVIIEAAPPKAAPAPPVEEEPPPSPEAPAPAPSPELVEEPDPTPPPVVEDEPTESPAQSLLRLREKLADGNFEELPVGTLSHGDSYFFHVSRATSWRSASRMARAFGGHLPLVENHDLRVWLAESIPADPTNDPDKQSVWIGATRNSLDSWQQVGGPPWPLESKPQGSGDYAALAHNGSVAAATSADKHPFFIQWHRDGSNPTRIREILAASGKSQQNGQPFFPPGFAKLGERRFLVVEEAHSFAEALELAKLGGGKLMSAATREEADWLATAVEGLAAPDGLWLGATLRDGLWTWNDHQAWSFARWSPASKAGSGDALLVFPGSGWAPADRGTKASGFVIEWSDEPQSPATPFVNLDTMARKASNLLDGLDEKRNKEAAENADEYLWKLDIWLRRRGNNAEIKAWTPRVQRVKAAVKNGRLPANVPATPTKLYPKPILEIASYYFKKQQVIDLEFITRAASIRDVYAARLKDQASKARKLGQREKAEMISEKIQVAADIKAWVESFGFISG